jgi:hypothetical protein
LKGGVGHSDREPLAGAEAAGAVAGAESNHRWCRNDCLRIARMEFFAQFLVLGCLRKWGKYIVFLDTDLP